VRANAAPVVEDAIGGDEILDQRRIRCRRLCPGGSRGHDQPQEQAKKLEHRCMLPSRSTFTIDFI
jgi:hypothetical protein